MSGDLLFHRAPTGPDLVFGDDDGIVQGAATATLDADFEQLSLVAIAAEPLSASMDADFGELPAQVQASYDHNISRPLVGQAATSWQAAHGLQIGRRNSWATMAHAAGSMGSRWQDARRMQSSLGCAWSALTRTRSSVASTWQDAHRIRIGATLRWQDATRTRHGARSRWQDAIRARVGMLSRWQDMDHSRRLHRESRWQDADPLHVGREARSGTAKHLPYDLRTHWQDAIVPPPGISPRPTEPGVTPHQPDANLIFCRYPTGADLVFGAPCDYNPQEPQQPGHIIPVRRSYMILNEVTLRRVDSNLEVVPLSLEISIDRDSWTWSWSADVAFSEWPHLSSLNGEPLELEAMVNGYRWRLKMEGAPSRTRSFGRTGVKISGRGIAAELDEPEAPSQEFFSASGGTAQQLMAQALSYNGVSLGWSLDWKVTDWLVPGNVWSVSGAPIAGVLDVAEAVQAVIQADRVQRVLRVLPRYPEAPWDWDALTPDIEIPPDIIISETLEPQHRADYNAVIVSGQAQGRMGRVVRAGTAGDRMAPMVTHPLLTSTDALRQRGIAELGNAGRMASVTLSMPISQDTTLIEVGQLASFVEAADPFRGLVVGTGVSAQRDEDRGLQVFQRPVFERHYS